MCTPCIFFFQVIFICINVYAGTPDLAYICSLVSIETPSSRFQGRGRIFFGDSFCCPKDVKMHVDGKRFFIRGFQGKNCFHRMKLGLRPGMCFKLLMSYPFVTERNGPRKLSLETVFQ